MSERIAISPRTEICPWCDEPFETRKDGGSPQKFCSTPCRRQFHRACRVWAEERVSRGITPMADVKRALAQRIR